MKSSFFRLLTLCVLSAMMVSARGDETVKIDVYDLDAVPDGNYLVSLEVNGKPERMNFEIKGNRAKCVNASKPEHKAIRGFFQRFERQPGAFVGRFEGENGFRATQLWIFRPDGVAAIRETPDRGEIQSAVPVKGTTIAEEKAK